MTINFTDFNYLITLKFQQICWNAQILIFRTYRFIYLETIPNIKKKTVRKRIKKITETFCKDMIRTIEARYQQYVNYKDDSSFIKETTEKKQKVGNK